MLLSTLRLSLRFVPANHRQLSLPFSAWKSLEKVVVYKAASGKEQNSCKPTGLWLELVPSQYLTSSWLEVGPLRKTRGILLYKILLGGNPFSSFCSDWTPSPARMSEICFTSMARWVTLPILIGTLSFLVHNFLLTFILSCPREGLKKANYPLFVAKRPTPPLLIHLYKIDNFHIKIFFIHFCWPPAPCPYPL